MRAPFRFMFWERNGTFIKLCSCENKHTKRTAGRSARKAPRGAAAAARGRALSPQSHQGTLVSGSAPPGDSRRFLQALHEGSSSGPAPHAAWRPRRASPGSQGAAPSSALARGPQGSPALRGALRQAGHGPRQFLTQRTATAFGDTRGGLRGEETSEQRRL